MGSKTIPPQNKPPACRGIIAVALIVQLAVLAGLVKNEVTLSGNESSRLVTVESLVEDGTFIIDDADFKTVDLVKIGGRFYSNKPLLYSVFLSAIYAPFHHLAGLNFQNDYHFLIALLTVLGVVPFSVLLTFLFQQRLRNRGAGCLPAVLLGFSAVFTTWIFSYGTSLNNHTPAAALVFLFILLLDREAQASKPTRTFWAGVVVGLLTGIEIPTGGIFLLVGGGSILFAHRPVEWHALGLYLAGFLIITLGLAGLNYAVYGYPLDAYLIPGAFEFTESIHAPGVAGLRRPANLPAYLFHMTVGNRGFFSHMPVLLFGILYAVKRRGVALQERLTLGAALVLFLFYGTRTGIFGGWAYGFRFLIPLIPVFFWWASLWFIQARRSRRLRVLFGLFLLAGLATGLVGTLNPWPVSYEGVATPPEAVEYTVRSPFLANLMVWSFQHDPDGPLFGLFAHRIYGKTTALEYLWKESLNRQAHGWLEQIEELADKWNIKRK